MIRQTSLEAYYAELPNFNTQQWFIYELIAKHPTGLTRYELTGISSFPINTVCGRVKELLDMHLIREAGVKINRSGRMAAILRKNG